MKRSVTRFVFIAAFLFALLAACQQTPFGTTLTIDVTPDDALVTVVRDIDGSVVHEGYGDVTLRGLLPGTYMVVTGEGDDMVIEYITIRAREREQYTLEIMAKKGPGGGGNGGGGNGGDGGGKGGTYAELVLLYRDMNGVPITDGPWEGEHGIEHCVQPITTERVPNPYYLLDGETPQWLPTVVNPVDGRTVTLVPLFAHHPEFLPDDDAHTHAGEVHPTARGEPGPPDDHEDEGGEPCDPLVITLPGGATFNYAAFATEVELERLNMVRSPEHVLRQHMREVEALILATDPELVTLDPAGRPVFDDAVVDAMPKLQGIRESLLEKGTLPGAGAYPFPFRLRHGSFSALSTWELSAFALGGSASKFGTINVDAVAYHDRIMGIANDWQPADGWPKKTLHSTELNEYFVDYSDFDYDRNDTFPGCVVYLDPANWRDGYVSARLLDVVEFSEPTPKQDNLAGYTQMAEDARAIIYFIHEYESVMAYADPVGLDSWLDCVALAAELNEAE
jgi:hypothetical protein